jgi:hypothetical protein
MTDIKETRQTSDEVSELDRVDMDLVHSSRTHASELVGTCVAVLTFLLFFLYDRATSGKVDFYLFRVSVLDVIVPMFLFTYSAFYYDMIIRSISKGAAKAISYLRRADRLIMFGLILLGFEPVLILFAIRLTEVALTAFVLWVVGIVIISKKQ